MTTSTTSNCCSCFPPAWRRALSERKPGSSRVALDVMHAVAIEILLACPMRLNNLAALDIERHLNWRGAGNSQTVSIYVPAAETKNGVAIEADFHRDTSALIRLYLKSYRPLVSTAARGLAVSAGDWRRPSRTGSTLPGPERQRSGAKPDLR